VQEVLLESEEPIEKNSLLGIECYTMAIITNKKFKVAMSLNNIPSLFSAAGCCFL
jgi:hypothetical protein